MSLSMLVCRMLLVWFLFAANLLATSVTWGYDAPPHPITPYDRASISAFDYGSASVLTADGEARRIAEEKSLFEKCSFSFAAKGTRALRLPATDASLTGTTTLGHTTPSGDVFLQSGLSRAEQISTLRHESVHAFFSPSGSGPLATFRQNLGQWGYDNSQLLRYSEEAMAETYGSGSLLQGLRHPLVNGYGISPGGLLLEGGVVGGGLVGAGYLGYQIGGGGH